MLIFFKDIFYVCEYFLLAIFMWQELFLWGISPMGISCYGFCYHNIFNFTPYFYYIRTIIFLPGMIIWDGNLPCKNCFSRIWSRLFSTVIMLKIQWCDNDHCDVNFYISINFYCNAIFLSAIMNGSAQWSFDL